MHAAERTDTENTLFQLMRCAMDLAAVCAALLNLMGLGRRPEASRTAQRDPADMGTAYGLEESLAPTHSSLSPSDEFDGDSIGYDQNAWLRPH